MRRIESRHKRLASAAFVVIVAGILVVLVGRLPSLTRSDNLSSGSVPAQAPSTPTEPPSTLAAYPQAQTPGATARGMMTSTPNPVRIAMSSAEVALALVQQLEESQVSGEQPWSHLTEGSLTVVASRDVYPGEARLGVELWPDAISENRWPDVAAILGGVFRQLDDDQDYSYRLVMIDRSTGVVYYNLNPNSFGELRSLMGGSETETPPSSVTATPYAMASPEHTAHPYTV